MVVVDHENRPTPATRHDSTITSTRTVYRVRIGHLGAAVCGTCGEPKRGSSPGGREVAIIDPTIIGVSTSSFQTMRIGFSLRCDRPAAGGSSGCIGNHCVWCQTQPETGAADKQHMNRLFGQNHPWRDPGSIGPAPAATLRSIRRDEPASGAACSAEPLAAPAQEAPTFRFRAIMNEHAMVEVLDRPSPDQPPSEAFHRKEHELGALFALLTPADSVELERRLSVSSSDDALALRFARLTSERRARLITFLRHARHRAAVSKSGARR